MKQGIIEHIEVYAKIKNVYFGIACHKRIMAALDTKKPFFVFFEHGEVSHAMLEKSPLFMRIIAAKRGAGNVLFIQRNTVTLVNSANWRVIKAALVGGNESLKVADNSTMMADVMAAKKHASAVIHRCKVNREKRAERIARTPRVEREDPFEVGKEVILRRKPNIKNAQRNEIVNTSRENVTGILICRGGRNRL